MSKASDDTNHKSNHDDTRRKNTDKWTVMIELGPGEEGQFLSDILHRQELLVNGKDGFS